MATSLVVDCSTGSSSEQERVFPAPPVEEMAAEIRYERDKLLTACDWTQVADAPVDTAAWATYRQELRDVPQQEGFPENIIWPTEPA